MFARDASAVFCAYDDEPPAETVAVRNLVHHHRHRHAGGSNVLGRLRRQRAGRVPRRRKLDAAAANTVVGDIELGARLRERASRSACRRSSPAAPQGVAAASCARSSGALPWCG
jgi:hypothetical protein